LSINDVLVKSYGTLEKLFKGNNIVFHHIPKCGGTSINRAIRKKYALSQFSLDANACRRVVEGQGAELDRFEFEFQTQSLRVNILDYAMEGYKGFVGGHVYFSNHVYQKFSKHYQFVTVLRDPVSRFLSDYYDRLLRNRSLHSVDADLSTYLESDDAKVQGCMITSYLCGELVAPNDLTESHIEQALENIKRFAVVGFIDDMSSFASQLSEVTGKSIKIGHDRKNLKKDRSYSDISPENIEKIEALCRLDTQLYQGIQKQLGKAS